MTDYGRDVGLLYGGGFPEINLAAGLGRGPKVVVGACINMILAEYGSLWWAYDVGAGLGEMQNAVFDTSSLKSLMQSIKSTCESDERVSDAYVEVRFSPRESKLTVKVSLTLYGADGVFDFVVNVGDAGITIQQSGI
jgi:hypothetical protein